MWPHIIYNINIIYIHVMYNVYMWPHINIYIINIIIYNIKIIYNIINI